jgi:hypothetical protein
VGDLAFLTCLVGSIDGVGAGEGAGQGRVQVDYPGREVTQERVAEHVHPAGQHHPGDVKGAEDGGKVGIVLLARTAGKIANHVNLTKSADELIAQWNEDHPDDPVED